MDEGHKESKTVIDEVPGLPGISWRQLTEFLARGGLTLKPPQPPVPEVDKNFVRIRKLGAKEFFGSTDPVEAEDWLRHTKRVLDMIGCEQNLRARYAVLLFQEAAWEWWETQPAASIDPLVMEWSEFVDIFNRKYVTTFYLDKKRLEFIQCRQLEGETISEYEARFNRLSRYGREFVRTNADRCERFKIGLRSEILVTLSCLDTDDFNAILNAALRLEDLEENRKLDETERTQSFCHSRPAKRGKFSSGEFQNPREGFNAGSGDQSRGGTPGAIESSDTMGSTENESNACETCGRFHQGECWGPRPGVICYNCREPGHYKRNCPSLVNDSY